MSAQTTIEKIEIEEIAVYIDQRGYLYCTYCYHAGVDYPCTRSMTIDGECDRCGKSGAESIEIVTGTAVIEYLPCKIF